MEKWEYLTFITFAHRDNPGVPNKNVAKFSPVTMEPEFDRLGQDGWELVHMEPVLVGSNLDHYHLSDGVGPQYGNAYFCAFKRRITGEEKEEAKMTRPGPKPMPYSLDEVLSGMLPSITADGFTDDAQKLVGVFKTLSQTHPLLAAFAAVGEGDFSVLLSGALQRLVDEKMLQHDSGRYSLTVLGRAACVRSKQTLFKVGELATLEAAARDFDAQLGK